MNSENSKLELVKKAQGGDMDAFETLIYEHEKIVYNIVYRMLNNSEDVKDISQEVFIKMFRNLDKFDNKSSFATWLYRIAVNTCIDEIRRRKGRETISIDAELELESSSMKWQYADDGETPEEAYLMKEKNSQIFAAMENLSEEHKTIITLRDLEELSYVEIAEICGLSLGTVKSRLARARNQLKNEVLKKREQYGNSKRQKNRREGKVIEM